MLRLNTFAVSHFCEKARWALDLAGAAYVERPLLPGPHLLVTRRLAKSSTVPILEACDRVIQGSTEILDYVATGLGFERLTPSPNMAARSAELEALAGHAFGYGIQRIFYAELLQDRQAVTALWTQAGPAWGPTFYSLAYPVIAAAVKRRYGITPDAVVRAKDRFRAAMAEMDRALASQSYLTGAEPKRADITVAALLAPICRPAQHRVAWPELPEALRGFAGEFAGSPTWNHVLKMYREHRARAT